MAMTTVTINTSTDSSSTVFLIAGGRGQITVNVTKDEPWDSLSKAFKKYTHTIDYSKAGSSRDGNPSDYSIKVVAKGSGINTFTLNSLDQWVENVEVYFRGDDKSNNTPLIVGFIYDSSSKCYYTWSNLKGKKNRTGTVGSDGVIKENDLVTRLLELGAAGGGIISRALKFVIRLGDQPVSSSEYPESGNFKDNKATVTKLNMGNSKYVEGYDGYEHSTHKTSTGYHSFSDVDEFYVTYKNDSVYFEIGSKTGHGRLDKVTVYYKAGGTGSGNGNPVLITLTFGSFTYVYSYREFVIHLKTKAGQPVKSLSHVIYTHDSSALQHKSNQEKERLRPLISFEEGTGVNDTVGNKNVTISAKPVEVFQGQGEHGYKFKKVTMTPITNDKDVPGGVSVGPWKVHSSQLFSDGSGNKIEEGAKIQEGDGVLSSITTGDVTSSSNKYSSITVYYATKTDSSEYSDYKSLLLEFVNGSGTKTYIKRTGKGGNQWAKAGDTDISGGKVDEKVLTQIAIVVFATAGSIPEGGGGQLILIYTSETDNSYFGTTSVFSDNPWDKLSKIFKMYTHTIEYRGGGGGYEASKYTIKVNGPDYSGGSVFTLNEPQNKVVQVELYFKGSADIGKNDPLVVRFVYEGSHDTGDSNKYYRWSVLKGKTENGSITAESFNKNDLVTVLLEELGRTVPGRGRDNKLVIRLDERPNGGGGRSQYPESGNNRGKITVKKVEPTGGLTGLTGVVGYEHSVSGSSTVKGFEGFYVSYENNSRFIMASLSTVGDVSEQNNLEKVVVYYKTAGTSPGGNNDPLLFVFHFSWTSSRYGSSDGKGTYEYKYREFIEELQKVRGGSHWLRDIKIITDLTSTKAGGRSDSAVQGTLQEESKRLERLITFSTSGVTVDGSTTGNKHISTTALEDIDKGIVGEGGYRFQKVKMTPNADDNDRPVGAVPGGGGSSGGPWIVYTDYLFTDNKGHNIDAGVNIPEGVISVVYTSSGSGNIKYCSITVYYYVTGDSDTGDKKALLVEFDPGGDGTKKYIKRTGKGGNQWAKAGDTDISGGKVDEKVLTQIAKEAGVIGGLGAGEQAAIGGGVVGVGGVGAGVGFAIYKYPQVFLSLIGR